MQALALQELAEEDQIAAQSLQLEQKKLEQEKRGRALGPLVIRKADFARFMENEAATNSQKTDKFQEEIAGWMEKCVEVYGPYMVDDPTATGQAEGELLVQDDDAKEVPKVKSDRWPEDLKASVEAVEKSMATWGTSVAKVSAQLKEMYNNDKWMHDLPIKEATTKARQATSWLKAKQVGSDETPPMQAAHKSIQAFKKACEKRPGESPSGSGRSDKTEMEEVFASFPFLLAVYSWATKNGSTGPSGAQLALDNGKQGYDALKDGACAGALVVDLAPQFVNDTTALPGRLL